MTKRRYTTHQHLQQRKGLIRDCLRLLVWAGILLLLLFGVRARSNPRFVHANKQNQYVLFDRNSKRLCWSGPANDLDAFMRGGPPANIALRRPDQLPPCRNLTQ